LPEYITIIFISVIEISSGDYGFELTERVIASTERKLPIIPICRSKYEFELDIKNQKISSLDQFKTLIQRMTLQHYRNRVRLRDYCLNKFNSKQFILQLRKNLKNPYLKCCMISEF